MNVISFFSYLRANKTALWFDGEVRAKVSNHIATIGNKKYIEDNKDEIIDLLQKNKIDSLDAFYRKEIIIIEPPTYPLSYAQERLWFIEQYEQGSNAYHIPMLVSLQEAVNIKALKKSICSIVDRHEVLRSVFKTDDGNDYQVVLNDALVINEYSYQDIKISKQIDLDINTPFCLTHDYPIRVSLYKEEKETKLLINIHHIASDGWSTDVLLKELQAYYGYYTNQTSNVNLPELSIQYKDFACWQREYLQGEELDKQIAYWQDRLSGYETLNLSTDYSRPPQIDYSGDNVSFEIDEEVSNKLRDIAKKNNSSLYSLMLSAFYVLLHKYTNQEDIVIGTPIANRHYSQTQDLIGFFVNSLALREQVDTNTTVIDLLRNVHSNLIEAQSHQDLPFEKLVTALDVEQDQSRHPIFQVMFGLQSFGIQENNLFKPVVDNVDYKVAKFDLECFIDDSQSKLQGSFNYATSLYSRDSIQRLVEGYQRILVQLARLQTKRIKDYSLLSDQDYQTIVYDWNDTDKDYPKDKTIYQLFQEQAEQKPNNIALVFEEQELTYKELDNRANQLARYIRKQYKQVTNQELKPDTLIPLCLERSLDMVIGILGVMKSGGAYVPMDPSYPEERFKHILKDTAAKLVITQSHLEQRLKAIIDISLISIDEQNSQTVYYEEDKSNLAPQSQSTDLAYVIYTSGTTGLPKGVMVEGSSLINLTIYMISRYEISHRDKVLQFADYTFDMSIEEVFPCLVSGSTLIICNIDERKDFNKIVGLCIENKISIVNFPPNLASMLSEIDDKSVMLFLSNIRVVAFGGDRLELGLIDLWSSYGHDLKIFNAYGPTEYTVNSTISEIKDSKNLTVGSPISNTKTYVLDSHMHTVPIGVVGELYIGGVGLARGYLSHPDLTAERFISNPFATESDIEKGYIRLYKTGDLVRWLPDGNIEYIGRNDFQVKIRGYRIELGEIENQLSAIEGIKQSCVLAKTHSTGSGQEIETNSQYLVGYYLPEQDSSLTEEFILSQLSQVSPEYMLPSVLFEIETMPLTVNGKLDRKALPEPEFINEDSFVAPTTELEITLCNIFASTLGLDKVGITDDFFRIGGNSILAIKLANRVSKELDANVSVADVFRFKNIQKTINGINALSIIKPFYNAYDINLPDMLLIHPGAGGCEVYGDLANKLENKYNCIGIDNYNIDTKKKISSLNELSELYLNKYLDRYYINSNKYIYLLGWSLGGQIALEMASILESKGIKNIKIVLLDTILTDFKLNQIKHYIDINKMKDQMRKLMLEKYDVHYANKIIDAFDTDLKLSKDNISSKFIKSKVTLLKALMPDNRFNDNISQQFNEYILSLKDNNIGKVVSDLTVKDVDSHHGNILEKVDEILNTL